MSSFLQTLNYSSSNEDSNSELKALCIDKNDSVLSITGSGARPLDLLIKNPARIVSIDFNQCQNHLLELKMAAIRNLEYEEFLEFLGVQLFRKRIPIYNNLKESLSTDARNFWDRHTVMIEKGVIYQGRWEKYFLKLAKMVELTRKKLRFKLFNCTSTDDQANLWRNQWDNFSWHLFLQIISSRSAWKVFGDPGFYLNVPDQFSIYKYLKDKFCSGFDTVLMRESPFLTLLFFGRYNAERALPVYLQKEHFKTIKNNLSCIQIVTGSLSEYLENCRENSFQKYSLSDFSSYTNIEDYLKIWKGIIKTASAKAIVCERQFLVKRDLPEEVQARVIRNIQLEKELMNQDDSVFYTFIIAEIN